MREGYRFINGAVLTSRLWAEPEGARGLLTVAALLGFRSCLLCSFCCSVVLLECARGPPDLIADCRLGIGGEHARKAQDSVRLKIRKVTPKWGLFDLVLGETTLDRCPPVRD